MSTALVESGGERNATLEQYEAKVVAAEQELRESFYHIGMALKRIKDDEPFKPKVGRKPNGKTTFKSWQQYCASKRLRYQRQAAARMIRAAVQRDQLPDLKSGSVADTLPLFWTIETAVEMARLDTKKDIRTAVSRIKQRLKKGERFTTKLVREVVDEMLGVDRKKKQKQAERLTTTPTLADHLDDMANTVEVWIDSLQEVGVDVWDEMATERPEVVKRLTQVLTSFISYLKE